MTLDGVVVQYGPSNFIEAEEARLSQSVADARESLREGARRIRRQREVVEELECAGLHS